MPYSPEEIEQVQRLYAELGNKTRVAQRMGWDAENGRRKVFRMLREAGNGESSCNTPTETPEDQAPTVTATDHTSRLLKILREPKSLLDLCEEMDLSPSQVKAAIDKARERQDISELSDGSYYASKSVPVASLDEADLPVSIQGNVRRFGVLGDTHAGSKAAKWDELNDFYNYLHSEYGVSHFLHAGDLTDGVGVYPEQPFESDAYGVDKQLRELETKYPTVGETFVISGNHDLKAYSKTGQDPGHDWPSVGKFHYLGPYCRQLKTLEGIVIEQHHGAGGGAYAMSYKMQKYIEQIPGGRKPRIYCLGHFHGAFYMPQYRNVNGFMVGCFQGETLFSRRLKLVPMIGGWMFEYKVDKHGGVSEFQVRWIPYYEGRRVDEFQVDF